MAELKQFKAIADGKEMIIHARTFEEALQIAKQYMKQYNVSHIEVKEK